MRKCLSLVDLVLMENLAGKLKGIKLKKTIFVMVMLSLVINLSGCGKSEEDKAAEQAKEQNAKLWTMEHVDIISKPRAPAEPGKTRW